MESRSDTPSLPEGMIEERVQVNRRKLEQLIQSPSAHSTDAHPLTTAEEFFLSVESSTEAEVIWPSRLKIGAKTKKDPFVKIIGYPDNVEEAKRQIQGVLERKQNRVTIRMDIAFTGHSHIIGRQGRNTQNIMRETGCHIHFPDSNRERGSNVKSNQVSIAGPINQVEKARHALRQLSPLALSFELSEYTGDVNRILVNPSVRQITGGLDVELLVRENQTTKLPFAIVRGNVADSHKILLAVKKLQTCLFQNDREVPVTLALDICAQQQPIVVGQDAVNIAAISQTTGAEILFPHSASGSSAATTFYIQGLVDQVILARRYLTGLLPFCLTFDTPSGAPPLDAQAIEHLNNTLNLCIFVRPKQAGEGEAIIIRGQERQLNDMYSLRQILVPSTDELFSNVCHEYDFMRDFMRPMFDSNFRLEPLNIQAPMSVNQAAAPVHVPRNVIAVSPYCTIIPAFSTPSPLSGSVPSVGTSRDDLAMAVVPTVPEAQTVAPPPLPRPQDNAVKKGSGRRAAPPPPLPLAPEISSARHPSSGYGSRSSSQSSAGGTPSSVSPPEARPLHASKTQRTLPTGNKKNRPTTLVPPAAGPLMEVVNSPGPITPVVTQFPQTTDFIQPSADEMDANVNPLASSILRSAVSIQQEEQQLDDWKVVGNGRDYREMLVRASKAIKEFPNGPRTPNSQFSGFFFSKSMPAHELNAKLREMENERAANKAQQVEGDEENRVPKSVVPPSKNSKKFDPDSTGYFDSLYGLRKSQDGKEFDLETDDIENLLTKLDLTHCIEVFSQEEISVSELLSLTEDDMKDLGIKFRHRRKLKLAIQKINQAQKDGSSSVAL